MSSHSSSHSTGASASPPSGMVKLARRGAWGFAAFFGLGVAGWILFGSQPGKPADHQSASSQAVASNPSQIATQNSTAPPSSTTSAIQSAGVQMVAAPIECPSDGKSQAVLTLKPKGSAGDSVQVAIDPLSTLHLIGTGYTSCSDPTNCVSGNGGHSSGAQDVTTVQNTKDIGNTIRCFESAT